MGFNKLFATSKDKIIVWYKDKTSNSAMASWLINIPTKYPDIPRLGTK